MPVYPDVEVSGYNNVTKAGGGREMGKIEAVVEGAVKSFIEGYCAERGQENLWRTPSVKYASTRHPGFAGMRAVTTERHVMP